MAILKMRDLLTTGNVEDILTDEDVVEVGAADPVALSAVLAERFPASKISRENNVLQVSLSKGTARLDEINSFCFNKGIVLNHLLLKKKRLEARFFELTNN